MKKTQTSFVRLVSTGCLLLPLLLDCTGQSTSHEHQGDIGLFDKQAALNADISLKEVKDEESIAHDGSDNWNPDEDGKRFEALMPVSANTDSLINPTELRGLTSCRLPNINLRRKILAYSDEWFVFTYCHLNILSANEAGVPAYPPLIQSFKNKISAFNFMGFAANKYLDKKFSENREMSNSDKLQLFRQIFLVSKFRAMTAAETQQAERLISKFGLYFLTRVYLINWYLSSFYHEHMDYSKEPQPEYESYEVFGAIKDNVGTLLNDVSYEAQNTSAGFKLSGISKLQPNTLFPEKCGGQVPSEATNFSMQFYDIRPHRDHGHRRHHHRKKRSKGQAVNFSGYFEKRGFNPELKDISLRNSCTNGLVFVLFPITTPQVRLQTWPDVNRTTTPQFDALNWSPNITGSLEGCKRPTFYPNRQLVDPFLWQDFVACVLQLGPVSEYHPLIGSRSAFDYVFRIKENFKTSDASIFLTESEIIGKLYQILTFRDLSEADMKKINSAVDILGFESALNHLVATWYYQAANNFFNYSQMQTIGLKRTKLTGIVRDTQNNLLSATNLVLMDSLENVVATAVSDPAGQFNMTADILRTQTGMPFRLKATKDAFAERLYENVLLDALSTQDVALVPLGEIGKDGGQIVTPNVTILAPPLASPVTVNFQVSPLVVAPDLNLEGLPKASFSITPDFAFSNFVTLRIKLPLEMLSFNPNDALMVVSKIAVNQYEPLDSSFDPQTNIITAKTGHFSEFLVVFRSTLYCFISQTGLRVCVPRSETYETHPMASILEKRISRIPEEMPFLRTYSKNILRNGGWQESIASQLDDPATFVNNGFAPECAVGDCPPIVKNYAIVQPTSQYDVWQIPATTVQLNVSTSGEFDIQAEQCRINPLASEPQLNLRAVQSSRINTLATVPLNNITFTYSGYRPVHRCKKILFGSYCWDDAEGTTLTDSFSHIVQAQVSGYDSSQIKDRNVSPPVWRKGTVVSYGTTNIDLGSFTTMPDRTYTLCYDVGGCYNVGINNTYRDQYISGYKSNTGKYILSKIYENIDASLISQLEQTHEPIWNDANCFPNNLFTVSGSIMGLSGSVVINLNNFEDLTISSNGAFYFSSQLPNNTNYEVLVKQNPQDQGCIITNKNGVINGANITNITINCQAATPNGTVVDVNSGRVWAKCTQGQNHFTANCEAAVSTDCSSLNINGGTGLGGFRDWRRPTLNELKTLVQCGNGKTVPLADRDDCGTSFSSPTINQQVFPNTYPSWYWTSSEIFDNNIDTNWLVNFGNGFSTPFIPESYWRYSGGVGPRPPWVINDFETVYERCVRGP